MRTVSGMACIVMGLAIVGPAFDVRATTEGRDEFLRVNPSNEVAGGEDVDHRALATSSDEALPTCDNGLTGVQKGNVCCSAECGTCGGAGCGDRPGGRDACCTGGIFTSGSPCSEVDEAPCFIVDETLTSMCSNGFPGIQTRNVCCSMECGRCGGSGCASRPGGDKSCCTSVILDSARSCSEVDRAPCFIEDTPAPTPAPNMMPTMMLTMPPAAVSTCSNGFPGFQDGNVCCAVECGLCGGVGCSAAPGGQDSCCTSSILTNGDSCSSAGMAPCLL